MLLLLVLACAAEPVAPPTPAPAPAAAPAAPSAAPPATGAAPATGAPPASGAPPAEGDATVPTLLGDAPGVAFVGNWTSGSCGQRDHARNLRFEEDYQWAAIDLVSPCPVGAQCAWSGLVTYAGTWAQVDKEVRMRQIGTSAQPGQPYPTAVASTTDGMLVEPDTGCLYRPGLTVPEGYAEEKVTPKVPR